MAQPEVVVIPKGGSMAVTLDQNVVSKSPLTGSAPVAVAVATSSAEAVAANASRKGLVLVNTSAGNISLALATPAVLNSGITLNPGGVWEMDEYTYSTAQVRAIASLSPANLGVQEFS